AIHEVASRGQSVIVAHAASRALTGMAGVLRILVTASPETRATRLATAQNIPAAGAVAAGAESDRERRDYFQRLYTIKDETPTQYAMVLNPDSLTLEHAAAIIVAAVQSGA